MSLLGGLLDMITGRSEREFVAAANAQMAAMDRLAEQAGRECEICAGVIYLCPDCKQPIKSHTHENDFMCDCLVNEPEMSSRFSGMLKNVHPIRLRDGAVIIGDGWPGPLKVRQ